MQEKAQLKEINPDKFVLSWQVGGFQVAKMMVPLFAEDEGKKKKEPVM